MNMIKIHDIIPCSYINYHVIYELLDTYVKSWLVLPVFVDFCYYTVYPLNDDPMFWDILTT